MPVRVGIEVSDHQEGLVSDLYARYLLWLTLCQGDLTILKPDASLSLFWLHWT